MDAATELILAYRYWFLLPLAFFEGPIVSFIVGFFISTGHLEFLPAYLMLLVGDLVPDVAYYGVGHYGFRLAFVRRTLRRAGLGREQYGVLKRLWHEHSIKTMFLSKLAYGLSTPFLISAGLVALPWRRFVVLVTSISAIQYAVLLTLGYFLGNYIGVAADLFWWIKVIVASAIVAVVIYIFVGRRVRRELMAEAHEEGGPPGE